MKVSWKTIKSRFGNYAEAYVPHRGGEIVLSVHRGDGTEVWNDVAGVMCWSIVMGGVRIAQGVEAHLDDGKRSAENALKELKLV